MGLTIDNNKFWLANIFKTANKKVNALSRINHYMKKNQKEL